VYKEYSAQLTDATALMCHLWCLSLVLTHLVFAAGAGPQACCFSFGASLAADAPTAQQQQQQQQQQQ
jgi:hypothetical protein